MSKMLFSLIATVTVVSAVGCGQHSGVVRGQGGSCYPGGNCPSPFTAQPYNNGWNCTPVCMPGADGAPMVPSGTHYYAEPKCLQYPSAEGPAVVQYPYYTLKGPDCFFYDK